MDRRRFIKTSCLTCAGGLGLSWVLQACTSHKYVTNYATQENKVIIKKSEFTVVKNEKTVQQKFLLVKPESLQFSIALYQVSENEYKASYMQCTHQGCELTAYETMMVCPCHGAEFNKSGVVINGPADVNLKTFNITQDNENIYIHL